MTHGVAQEFERAAKCKPNYPGGFEGRGVVICAGGLRLFSCAYVCVRMLREAGCTLPVQFWYLGKKEMTPAMEAIVEPYNVTCVDAYEVRKKHPARILRGWEVKPYSIIWSPFKQVLYLDADNMPVRDPTFLFETKQFAETGAIFWPDFGRLGPERDIWRICGVQYRDEPEFESGQMVIDKERCWAALHLTMWMNEHSDFFYKHIHGDKDTFHMAWRKLEQPYSMVSTPIRALPGVMCQHDFDGGRLFQHRNLRKWNVFGDNPEVPGFEGEDRCLEFLAELRGLLSPQGYGPYDASRANEVQKRAAEELCNRRWSYRRVGIGDRPMKFSLDGTFIEGGAGCEEQWNLSADGETLIVSGRGMVTFTAHRDGPDRWSGQWLVHEKNLVELIAID